MTTRRIDAEWLRQWATADPRRISPSGAYRIAHYWNSAATWCLQPELLEKAATEAHRRGQEGFAQRLEARPVLPESPGTCCVLFALRDPTAYAALRKYFLMPLEWTREAMGQDLLPPSLQAVAEHVQKCLSVHKPSGARGPTMLEQPDWSAWRLRPHSAAGFATYDLRRFEALRCESCAVALAAGLLLAVEGGVPATDVWATASLNRQGRVVPVDLLQAKVAAAVDHGARCLFVPSSQAHMARHAASQTGASVGGHALEISELSESAANLTDAICDYLARLDLPPRGERFEPKRDWYLRQCGYRRGGDRNEQLQEYYQRELLDAIIQRARARLLTGGGETQRPRVTRLVTIASEQGRHLIPLTAGIVGASYVLILHTTTFLPAAEAARQHVRQRALRMAASCDVFLAPIQIGSPRPTTDPTSNCDRRTPLAWGEEFEAAIQHHWPDVDPRTIVLDITPGTKEMSLAMVLEVARAGNWLFYLRQDWGDRGREPGEEQPVFFPAPELA